MSEESQDGERSGRSGTWGWPVDRTAYDRVPFLYPDEVAALDGWARHCSANSPNTNWPAGTALGLERLLHPINDVLDYTGAPGRPRANTIHLILHELYRRQSSFWAWTPEDWRMTFDIHGPLFQAHPHHITSCRQQLIAISYLLGCFTDLHTLAAFSRGRFAVRIFGQAAITTATERILGVLQHWGYGTNGWRRPMSQTLASVFLFNRSPRLEDLTSDLLLATLDRTGSLPTYLQESLRLLSRALLSLRIIDQAIPLRKQGDHLAPSEEIAPEWLTWCQRWRTTTTLAPETRDTAYYKLLKAGQWLAQEHPEVTNPNQWTRELAAAYVAAVDRMTVGQFNQPGDQRGARYGQPLLPRTKADYLWAMRTFFRDCQAWGWIPARLDPRRCFATPRTISNLIGPNPRIIADDIWAKLLWAGLNLTSADAPAALYDQAGQRAQRHAPWYPLELIKAVVVVWLFAGLRAAEICRLRVGCIRWQKEDLRLANTEVMVPKETVCFLEVPTNKTSTTFTKPVDRVVGEAIQTWEQVRPQQPAAVDRKRGERVHYLFAYRGKPIAQEYVNRTLIPLLCRKAGVPREDARGPITSHRARSTIASQLFTAKEPMSLFELQAWLGHKSPAATQHYAKITPTKLTKAYTDAGYFSRNRRTIAVLINQDAIKSGQAAAGAPWKFYDLGHGYCTYDFFDQCPHRMACAKCAFYRPKGSSQAQLLEAKTNLHYMLQEIPLTDAERAAVEDGVIALEKLSEQLIDVPTPAGPTPRQLSDGVIAEDAIGVRRPRVHAPVGEERRGDE